MKIDPTEMEEHRQEAQRLTLLPKSEQRAIVALHRLTANDRRATKEDRGFAKRRAYVLEVLLKLTQNRKNKL